MFSMRKLIDSLVIFLLRWCFNWLYSRYDFWLDGVELWISNKLPDFSDSEYDDFCPDMSEIPDPDLEE